MGKEFDLSQYEDVTGHEPATNEEIAACENELGLSFSEDYNAYLRVYGFASVGEHELTGVSSFPRRSVVAATERERSFDEGVRSDQYVIERTGVDGGVAWQSADGHITIRYPNGESYEVAKSLAEYLS